MFKLFNKTPKIPEYDHPLGLKIGSAITLNALDFKILQNKLKVEFPGDTLIVKSYGFSTLDNIVKMHFFYTDTDAIIRVTTENKEVKEVVLFTIHDTVYPIDEDDWNFWIGNDGIVGDYLFNLEDGTEYQRVLFEDNADHVDPVDYTETISLDNDTDDTDFLVEHKSMLYARYIDSEEDIIEWLVLDCIDTGDGSQINIMPGITLTEGMYEVT